MRAWQWGEPLARRRLGHPRAEARRAGSRARHSAGAASGLRPHRPPHRLRRRLLRYDDRAIAFAQDSDRRRHCLCRPGSSRRAGDGARRAARSRANRDARRSKLKALSMRILFVGDIVGRSGRTIVYERLPGSDSRLEARSGRGQRRERGRRLRHHRSDLSRAASMPASTPLRSAIMPGTRKRRWSLSSARRGWFARSTIRPARPAAAPP